MQITVEHHDEVKILFYLDQCCKSGGGGGGVGQGLFAESAMIVCVRCLIAFHACRKRLSQVYRE